MTLRKWILYLMLATLAAAALGGTALILTVGQRGIGQVVGSAITVVIAAALMLAASFLVDREKLRSAGILLIAILAGGLLLILAGIWDLPSTFGMGYGGGEAIVYTVLFLALPGLPAAVFLCGLNVPVFRWSCRAGLCSCVVVFLIAMVGVWPNAFMKNGGRWDEIFLVTSAAISGVAVVVVAALVGVGTGDRRHWRWAAILLALVAGLLFGGCIATELSERWGRVYGIVMVLAALIAHANAVMACSLKPSQLWVRIVTIVAALFTTGAAIALLTTEDEFAGRLLGAGCIITGCGTLALLVLARMNRKIEMPTILAEVKELTLICPQCQKKQTVAVGGSRCVDCGLRFHIRVEEPRCPACNYLLYMLASDRCPECGSMIAASAVPVVSA